MDDIRAARARIREFVAPLRRQLSAYIIKEQLGYSPVGFIDTTTDGWQDDGVLVTAEVMITATKEYPVHPYCETELRSNFRIAGFSRADAIEGIWQDVVKVAEHWKQMVNEDVEFSKTVGRRLKLIKNWQHRQWPGQGYQPSWTTIPESTEGVVTKHIPGYLIVDFLPWRQVKFPTNAFRSYHFDGNHIRIHDPYCTWIDP